MKLMALSPQQLWSLHPWQWASNRWNRGCKESLGLDRLPQDFYLHVGTYNVRTLSSDDKLLEMELSRIKWTTIGLSEFQLKKLDCSKASGEDNITGGVLQDVGEAVVNLLT